MLRVLSVFLSFSLLLAAPLASAQTSEAPSAHASVASDAASSPDSVATDDVGDEVSWDRFESYTHEHVDEYVGIGNGQTAPFERQSAVYRSAPAVRYNRVEGLVVGLQRDPLDLRDADDTAKLYGQLGYATALQEVRYTLGVESKLIRDAETGLKVGVTYQRQTLTPDRWKTPYAENSLAGIGFEYDFFDYYEAEGVTVYAVQALPNTVRLTAGFRSEEHRPLARNTRWSLFNAGTFRTNPQAKAGRLKAGFVSLQGGHIEDLDDLPTGQAFRISALLGKPFGGDLSVNRYELDARLFLPLSHDTRLGFRLRGGYATSGAPLQTQFTIGGIGSLRSYNQNALRGTRMLLGNAEYIIDGASFDDEFLEDVFLVGLFDAGWVGQAGERFRAEDVVPSAGFGVGLDERKVRLDVSWPLRDHPAAGSGPSVWLRITPNF